MKHRIKEGYYTTKDASTISGLEEEFIKASCIKTKGKGLSYIDENKEWMIHSSAIEGLILFFSSGKGLNSLSKK